MAAIDGGNRTPVTPDTVAGCLIPPAANSKCAPRGGRWYRGPGCWSSMSCRGAWRRAWSTNAFL